jgi:hypothetical protein
MTEHTTHRPLASDALPLVFEAAFCHPEPQIRYAVQEWTSRWVESLIPRVSAGDVRSALQAQSGTLLEPFSLTPPHLEISVLAIRAAFSEAAALRRFRVVSSGSLGLRGGLVLTDALQSYYVERVAWARRRKTPWSVSFVAPGALSTRPPVASRNDVLVTVTASGLELDVPAACWGEGVDAHTLAATVSAATLDGTLLTPRHLEVVPIGDIVRLRTREPEALFRLTAMMEASTPLVLAAKGVHAITRLAVLTSPLTEASAAFPTVPTQTTLSTRQWAGFWAHLPVPVPLELRVAISRAFPAHDTWLTPELVTALV